eukprot:3733804-Rhodomonas_salina.2
MQGARRWKAGATSSNSHSASPGDHSGLELFWTTPDFSVISPFLLSTESSFDLICDNDGDSGSILQPDRAIKGEGEEESEQGGSEGRDRTHSQRKGLSSWSQISFESLFSLYWHHRSRMSVRACPTAPSRVHIGSQIAGSHGALRQLTWSFLPT